MSCLKILYKSAAIRNENCCLFFSKQNVSKVKVKGVEDLNVCYEYFGDTSEKIYREKEERS